MNILIVENSKYGKAVFANIDIPKGTVLIEFKGDRFNYDEIPDITSPDDDRFVQIDEKMYMGPSGDLDDLINHSCDPNAGLKFSDKIILTAIRNIMKGEEITWDYSTTMDEDFWEMDCACESKKCRKKIRDFKHLPTETQKFYIDQGIVPDYIIRKLEKIKKS